MSIKSIDTQIMVARTADFSRDTSALQKRPEVSHDYQAIREKINDAQDQTRVAKSSDSQKPELHPDEGGGGGYDGGDGTGREKEKSGKTDADLLVSPSNNVIDIRV